MNHDALISVIVPVYKVEKYLNACVESIVNQTYQNLEIILVDDGSPDSCPAICDDWANRDSRIRVIHQENLGAAGAKNTGLNAITGSFFSFVDGDDLLPANAISSLYKIIAIGDCQIVEGSMLRFEKSPPSEIATHSTSSRIYNAEEALMQLMLQRDFHQTPPGKLYHHSLAAIRFTPGTYIDDEFWTYRVFAQAQTLVSCKTPVYYYRQHPESAINRPYSLGRLDAVRALDQRVAFMSSHFPNLVPLAISTFSGCCMYHFQKLCLYSQLDPDRQHRQWILGLMRKNISVSAVKNMSFKERTRFTLFQKSPYLFCEIRNLLKRGI